MAKGKFKSFKELLLGFVSCLALVAIGWMLFFGRGKILGMISPYLGKIPKDENKLTQYTDDVLGKAVEAAKGGKMKQTVQKGAEYFESSQYAEPARDIRENVVQRVDEVIQSVKELPAKEVMIIKQQVCKEWFPEIATPSAN